MTRWMLLYYLEKFMAYEPSRFQIGLLNQSVRPLLTPLYHHAKWGVGVIVIDEHGNRPQKCEPQTRRAPRKQIYSTPGGSIPRCSKRLGGFRLPLKMYITLLDACDTSGPQAYGNAIHTGIPKSLLHLLT